MNNSAPNFSLQGRKALITGSSQGIGKALASALAHSGAEVVLNGRDTAKLDAAVAELKAAGLAVTGCPFDVTSESEVTAAANTIGPIDVLVNNAGIQRRSPLIDMSLADWETVLSTNLTSAFLVSRAFAPAMIESRAGKIINIC
ncbi:MAG: SDR family NAD(P)-dependent oxidoreductase, partial [Verrucomicrobiia bacterium]